jgi:hypothetical protein
MQPVHDVFGSEIQEPDDAELEQHDPRAQLRMLYALLTHNQERFDEFKRLLSLYPIQAANDGAESAEAADVRERLNRRISTWLRAPFGGLSATQVQLWRAIVVDERWNVALSPWPEANSY